MKEKKVVILDYQLGNLFSVKQACETVGINTQISSDKQALLNADAIILPGVGAFLEAMENLAKLDLINPIKALVADGKPLFGVCLGQQLLFSESEEFGAGEGLNLIPGKIKKFPVSSTNGEGIKVPQIGWNQVSFSDTSTKRLTPLADIKEGSYMYFVHSYYVMPDNQADILTGTEYEGLRYCSAVYKNNIFATQFHPEKSGELGLTIYRNWAIQNNLI